MPDGIGLSESVTFVVEGDVCHGDPACGEGLDHALGLVRGHHLVLHPLEEDDRTPDPVGGIQGRAFPIGVAGGGIRSDEPVQVPGLEFVGIPGEGLQVADPVVAGPGAEGIFKGQRRQGGIAAGAAAGDNEAFLVHPSLLGQESGPGRAVLDVVQPPGAIQGMPIQPAKPGAAAIIDLEHREAAAGPKLDPQVQRSGGAGGRPPMALDDQRRFFVGEPDPVRVRRRIVKAMRDRAAPGGKRNVLGMRHAIGVQRDRTTPPHDARAAIGRPIPHQRRRLARRSGAHHHRIPQSHHLAIVGVGQPQPLDRSVPHIHPHQAPDPQLIHRHNHGVRPHKRIGAHAEDPLRLPGLKTPGQNPFDLSVPLPIQIPPTGPVGDEIQLPPSRPHGLKDRFLPAPRHPARRLRQPLLIQIRYPEFCPIPRHVGMIPRQPRQPPTLRTQTRRRIKIVPPNQRRRPRLPLLLQLNRSQPGRRRLPHLAMILHHTDHPATPRIPNPIGISPQTRRRHRRRLPPELHPIQPLVFIPTENHLPTHHHEIPTPVLLRPRPHTVPHPRQLLRRSLPHTPPHQYPTPPLRRPRLYPVHKLPARPHLPQPQTLRRNRLPRHHRRPCPIGALRVRWQESFHKVNSEQ